MDYPECLDYLKKLGDEVSTMKFGLETVRTLLGELGNPHLDYPSVIVGGTNGKGSVAAFLNAAYSAGGIRSGLYTSPHLVRVEERFQVDGLTISSRQFARCLSEVVCAIERLKLPFHPTYFETLTALAFVFFRREGVELAILEVGMGGRLDSTNVVDPVLAVLTPVGLDHEPYLGDTLEKVALEKAGILAPGRPALIGRQRRGVLGVLLEQAGEKGAVVHEMDRQALRILSHERGRYRFRFRNAEYQLLSRGRHQVDNAALALQAVEILSGRFPVSRARIRRGIEGAALPGRVQCFNGDPTVVLDGAHNPDAVEALVSFLEEHTDGCRTLVIAMMGDKKIGKVAQKLKPHFDQVLVTRVRSVRAAPVEDLTAHFPGSVAVEEPVEALDRALGSKARTVVATGSLYLVGELLNRHPALGGSGG